MYFHKPELSIKSSTFSWPFSISTSHYFTQMLSILLWIAYYTVFSSSSFVLICFIFSSSVSSFGGSSFTGSGAGAFFAAGFFAASLAAFSSSNHFFSSSSAYFQAASSSYFFFSSSSSGVSSFFLSFLSVLTFTESHPFDMSNVQLSSIFSSSFDGSSFSSCFKRAASFFFYAFKSLMKTSSFCLSILTISA